ncbi:MAG: hypothetical protein MJ246_08360 [Clostridia bacterium]|nr:hypothetical protein [Clostridia bacterium]
MNNAEINYLSSESVCRLFSFEEDKVTILLKGYNLRRTSLIKEVEKLLNKRDSISDKKNGLIVKFDKLDLINGLDKVVEKYNELIEFYIENKNYKAMSKELKRISDVFTPILFDLSVNGIDITRSGKISIDKKQMKKRTSKNLDGFLKLILKEGGFIDKIMAIAINRISEEQLRQSEKKVHAVGNLYTHVNGKTMSAEPLFLIDSSRINMDYRSAKI